MYTESQVVELMRTSTSEKEWDENSNTVRQAWDGELPPFWFKAIISSGVASEVARTWDQPPVAPYMKQENPLTDTLGAKFEQEVTARIEGDWRDEKNREAFFIAAREILGPGGAMEDDIETIVKADNPEDGFGVLFKDFSMLTFGVEGVEEQIAENVIVYLKMKEIIDRIRNQHNNPMLRALITYLKEEGFTPNAPPPETDET